MYMFNSNRCQQSESEHVECDVVGSAGHHPHLILQLLGTGLGIHFNQTRLQQMLWKEGEGESGREDGWEGVEKEREGRERERKEERKGRLERGREM